MARAKFPPMVKMSVWIGVFFIAIVLVVFWIIPSLIERHFFSPQERAEFQTWERKRIHLPAEALSAPPFQPSTKQSAIKFHEAWNAQNKTAKALFDDLEGTGIEPRRRINPDTLNYPEIEQRLVELQPMMDAFAELVSQPDYTIEAEAWGRDYDDECTLPVPEFYAVLTNMKLLMLRSYCQVHGGNYADADHTVGLMLRASGVDAYDMIITTLIAIAGKSVAADAWINVVRHCQDKALLRQMLNNQIEQARHPIEFPSKTAIISSDMVGCLRRLKRRGINSDFQDKTGFELQILWMRQEGNYIRQFVLPLVRSNPMLTQTALDGIERHRAKYIDTSLPVISTFIRAMLFSIGRPSESEARGRSVYSAAKFDLLTLETAKKIYTLEHGKPPATIGDLVPQYLPQIPRDRLGDTASLKSAPEHYYSIGPDKVDDHASLRYDPTNGTISPGDLFFR